MTKTLADTDNETQLKTVPRCRSMGLPIAKIEHPKQNMQQHFSLGCRAKLSYITSKAISGQK